MAVKTLQFLRTLPEVVVVQVPLGKQVPLHIQHPVLAEPVLLHLLVDRLYLTLVAVEAEALMLRALLLLVQVVLEAVVMVAQAVVLVRTELLTQAEALVEVLETHQQHLEAQAAQESSSLNTSPSPITKSSNHRDHGPVLRA